MFSLQRQPTQGKQDFAPVSQEKFILLLNPTPNYPTLEQINTTSN